MAFTAEEQEYTFENMYGCNPNYFKESAMASLAFERGGMEAIIISVLSDAQEVLTMGNTESARKYINLAKFLIVYK